MRDISEIKKSRDKMQSCVDKLNVAILQLKRQAQTEDDLKKLGKLNILKEYYRNQIIGINFCLNEDDKLNSFCESSLFKNEPGIYRYFYR